MSKPLVGPQVDAFQRSWACDVADWCEREVKEAKATGGTIDPRPFISNAYLVIAALRGAAPMVVSGNPNVLEEATERKKGARAKHHRPALEMTAKMAARSTAVPWSRSRRAAAPKRRRSSISWAINRCCRILGVGRRPRTSWRCAERLSRRVSARLRHRIRRAIRAKPAAVRRFGARVGGRPHEHAAGYDGLRPRWPRCGAGAWEDDVSEAKISVSIEAARIDEVRSVVRADDRHVVLMCRHQPDDKNLTPTEFAIAATHESLISILTAVVDALAAFQQPVMTSGNAPCIVPASYEVGVVDPETFAVSFRTPNGGSLRFVISRSMAEGLTEALRGVLGDPSVHPPSGTVQH